MVQCKSRIKNRFSELDVSETIRNQLIESLIPCDSCVALFEYEKDMKDYLASRRELQIAASADQGLILDQPTSLPLSN